MDLQREKVKVKLLEETLSKNNDSKKDLEKSNKQLIYLLEKYDDKVTELQNDIDLKDL